MKEIWKDVPNYKGFYQVSSFGNVKSLDRKIRHHSGCSSFRKGKIMKSHLDSRGYLRLWLSKNGKSKRLWIHILVAIVFRGHVQSGYKGLVVDHIDNVSINNNLSNIQLITTRENVSKDLKNGSSKYTGVHWCKRNKKWISRILINNKSIYLGSFFNELKASKSYQNKLKTII